MKKMCSLFSVLLITGCGGGSNVQPNPQSNEFSVSKVFSDNAGVFNGTYTDGTKVVGISPDVTALVNGANDPIVSSTDINSSDFPIVDTHDSGNIRSGALTVGDLSVNVTIYDDSSEDALFMYWEVPNQANLVLAFANSDEYSAPNGTYTYSGLFSVGERTLNPYVEHGTFNMTANFTSNTISFNGQTNNYSLTGDAILNTDTGSFNGNSLRFEDEYYYYSASIYGLMGGQGATATSGVFHTNDQGVDYAGAFVGQR